MLAIACSSPPTAPAARDAQASVSPTTGASEAPLPPMVPDFGEDIRSIELTVDLAAMRAEALVSVDPPPSGTASFEIGDLAITAVAVDDAPVPYAASPGRLDVDLRRVALRGAIPVRVRYGFAPHTHADGWNPSEGLTFLWPQFCGNLYPCKSDPSDGVRFKLDVKGIPAGATAVFPKSIPAEAPPYMPAIAVGSFTRLELGTTTAGTKVSVFHRPGEEANARRGTKHLVAVFDFYERTYGPYAFGGEVGSVSADWASSSYGGMEHHPFWHVGASSLDDEDTHAHEAAHGWFGNGVRIGCWQDFVLSEGTATYLAARALASVGVDEWKANGCKLKAVCDPAKNTIAYPATCERVDMLHDPLWSNVPYMKGAFFLKDVAAVLGEDAVDAALASFYRAHVGHAAHMSELVDALVDAAGMRSQKEAIRALSNDWLTTRACPTKVSALCPSPR